MRSLNTSLKTSWMRPWTLVRSQRYAFIFGVQFAVLTSMTATCNHKEDMFFTSALKEVQKLRKASLWLKSSTSTIKQLEALMVLRDVVTHWNYTHAMIKRALMLQKVIISFSLCMYGDTNCECFHRLLTGLFLRTRRFSPWCCQARSGSFLSNSAQFSRWVHYIIQIGFELTPSTSTVTRYSPMPTSAAPPPSNVSSSTSDNSFLASIARCPIASTATAATQPAALKPVSKRERYLTLEHGKMDFEALNTPLLWWKVRSLMQYVICLFLT